MKIPKPILERRRSIRIDEALPFQMGPAGYDTEAKTVNISTTGTLCLIERDIPLMTKLNVALSIPPFDKSPKKTIKIKGVVVRKDRDAAGKGFWTAIYFSDIKPDDQRTLQSFIEYRLNS